MSPRPGPATFRTLLAAALVGSLGLGLAPGSSGASPAPPGADREPARVGTVGTWKVSKTGPDTYQVTWRSPRRLPVTSDRATIVSDGVQLGVPTLRDDGRTVVTTVTASERPVPADLDVLLSGDRLDSPGLDQTDDSTAPADLRAGPELADDPAEPGPYDVVSTEYEVEGGVKLPRMRQPIEMVGHIVEPVASADTGPRPLVVFLHGRHSYCYDPTGQGEGFDWPCEPPLEEIPSHLGYDYIQQVLASQGFATVSIRVNGINAQDFRLADGGADARAQIVQRTPRALDVLRWPPTTLRTSPGWCSSGTAVAARASTAPRSRSRSTRPTGSSDRCCSRPPTSAPRPRRTSRR